MCSFASEFCFLLFCIVIVVVVIVIKAEGFARGTLSQKEPDRGRARERETV